MVARKSDIDEFLTGDIVRSLDDAETRVYEFNLHGIPIERKLDFNDNSNSVLRYRVHNVESMVSTWKKWGMYRGCMLTYTKNSEKELLHKNWVTWFK